MTTGECTRINQGFCILFISMVGMYRTGLLYTILAKYILGSRSSEGILKSFPVVAFPFHLKFDQAMASFSS